MAQPLAITLHESAEETASGASVPIDVGSGVWPPKDPAANPAAKCDRNCAFLTLDLTAFAGDTFDLLVETSIGGNDWSTVATAEQRTAASAQQLFAFYCKRYMRVSWTLEGGNATFSVIGEALQCYINLHDLEQAMPASMFAAMPREVLAHAMLDATDEAESYLRKFFTVPIVSWGHDLRLMVGKMAFYHAMQRRGYNPDNIDSLIRKNYEDALSWLKGAAQYSSIVDSSPTEVETGAYCVSGPPRGWYPW